MPIEQVSPELERIVNLDQDIEELGSGFSRPDGLPAEGPLWWKEGWISPFQRHRQQQKNEVGGWRGRKPGP